MMTLETKDGNKYLNSLICRPAIYLDHCALRKIAHDDNFKEIFFIFLKSKGTFLFSLFNVYDIVGQDPGPSIDELKLFLSGMGTNWVLIKSNPIQVMKDVEKLG